jgi:hypothetical protein
MNDRFARSTSGRVLAGSRRQSHPRNPVAHLAHRCDLEGKIDMKGHHESAARHFRLRTAGAALAASLAALLLATSVSATPTSSDYSITFFTTPDAVAGDVLSTGGALFVGIGSFGVGSQQVVRIDSGGTTVLAEGFNSLGGFAYDSVNDRLIVGDNAGDLAGAVTGDTVYGIPDPFGSPALPLAALGLELLAAGSLPGYADVVLDPSDPTGDTLFINDASGSFPPLGVTFEVEISTATLSVIQTGLQFAAGLAVTGSTLYVGDSLLGGGGEVSTTPLGAPSTPRSLLASPAAGLFGLALAQDGSLIASSGDSILRIDATTGEISVLATGFGFAAGLSEAPDGTIYALDGFAALGEENRIWVLTPIPEPATAWLLVAGLGVLALRRRRA